MSDTHETHWPLGVFTSIDAGKGVHLQVAHELGIPTIQLHVPMKAHRTARHAERFLERLEQFGIELTVVFCGFEGESYAEIPTVARTVGLTPPETRNQRFEEACEIADFARQLQCDVVGLHLGLVPHDRNGRSYAEVLEVTRQLCDYCNRLGQRVHLETGQETAEAIRQFIRDVERDNLFINFDPANMILYGTSEPLGALRTLNGLVRSVHCKDAVWSSQPGRTWGTEVPLDEGQVNIQKYLATLQEIGYAGPLTIEREIPEDPERQRQEVGQAVEVLQRCKRRLMGG